MAGLVSSWVFNVNPFLFLANVTDAELARLSEELWRLEGPNNCAELIRVNLQSRTSYGATVDQASQP